MVLLALLGLQSTSNHTVVRGETLDGIARRYGTTVRALAEANAIANPDRIRAGERLVVPSGSGGGGGGSGGSATSYTVRPGDTLAGIARRHGTTVADLVARNGLRNPNLIIAGRSLTVAGGGGGSTSPGTGSGGSGGGQPGSHVVRAGETIAGIAGRHGISQATLVAANGLVDGRIYAGQRLYLSAPNIVPSTEARRDASHVVASGEFLSNIARRYGVSVRSLVDANGIADPNRIRVGTRLTIPGATGVTSVACPVPGARFMNDWGFPRSGGRFHNGNDLFAPRGTPVHAPVSGSVTQTVGQLAGNQVRLVGDDGNHWYGTHLDRFGASGRVQAGDVIGYVGDTGNARGGPPHLHLELHPGGGAPVNPYPLVLAAC